jgi:hypothetical protein
MTCAGFKDVDAHFAGRGSPRREQAMRAHLVTCQACRTRYDRHLQLAALDRRSLSFEERMALGLGLRRRWQPAWTSVAVVAMALGAWLLVARPADDLGMHTRAGAAGALVLRLDAQTEVIGFRTGGGAPALSGRRLHASEELAFAYRNGGRWPRLMVFARDESGVVYWFHPQWTDPAADPQAVAIEQDAGLRELTTAVSHRFGGHRLSLCALGVRTPLSVREVEATLAGARAPAEALAGKGAVACADVEVTP